MNLNRQISEKAPKQTLIRASSGAKMREAHSRFGARCVVVGALLAAPRRNLG